MANDGNFVPQGSKVPQGAQEVTIRGSQGPMLGRHMPIPRPDGASSPTGGSGGASATARAPQQAQVSPANTPRGAQQVPLSGYPTMGATAPATSPQNPYFARPSAGMDVHLIQVEAIGPDGTTRYIAEFDAVFPKGSKILGVRRLASEE